MSSQTNLQPNTIVRRRTKGEQRFRHQWEAATRDHGSATEPSDVDRTRLAGVRIGIGVG